MKILGRELRFGDPELADIVVFDECNSHIVREALNKKYRVAVFKIRPEDIWVGPRVIFHFFRFLARLQLRGGKKHRRGVVIGILWQLLCIYYESCLVAMKPKAVVTFIDNSSRFGWLSKHCRKFPLLAIQNGSRLSYAADEYSDYYLQHFFCFGAHEPNLFPRLGYHVENFYPVGSLLASLYFDQKASTLSEKFDLLVVSTWRGNIGFSQEVKDTMRSMEIMDHLIARYVQSRGIRAAIILRAERDSEHWFMPELGVTEENYYRDIYGDSVEIIETRFSERNIFPTMQQSHLIISGLSSALLEAYGVGKKILYCNFTGVDTYHRDLDSSIVTTDSEYESFTKKLDVLLNMPQAEYSRLHRECRKYYMSNPADKPTFQAIADKIDSIIKTNEIGSNE